MILVCSGDGVGRTVSGDAGAGAGAGATTTGASAGGAAFVAGADDVGGRIVTIRLAVV